MVKPPPLPRGDDQTDPVIGGLSGDVTSPAYARQLRGRAEIIEKAVPENTKRAYESDWRSYDAWCQALDIDPSSPSVEYLSTYLSAMAMGQTPTRRVYSVATIERHLAAIVMRYRLAGHPIDTRDPQITMTMRGIRRSFMKAPARKRPLLTEDLLKIIGQLDLKRLNGIQDRAILLMGFAGGLRRSEIVGLNVREEEGRIVDPNYKGWVEVHPEGLLLVLRSKGDVVRTVAIGKSGTNTCPVAAYLTWVAMAKIHAGPVFRTMGRGGRVTADRLPPLYVTRLVKRCVTKAGVEGVDLDGDVAAAFGAHSLRAGLATSANAPDKAIQAHLGHASPEMTQRYIRHRDAFRINMTKKAGL
jgi:integrase